MTQPEIAKLITEICSVNAWPLLTGSVPNIVYLEDCDASGNPLSNKTGVFDDRCILLGNVEGEMKILQNGSATTKAGAEPTAKKRGKQGVARVAAGYHPPSWQFGYHKHRKDHPALRQVAPILITRDINGDGEREGDRTETGIFYLNQHGCAPGRTRWDVGYYSEGCLVRRLWDVHLKFIKLLTVNDEWTPTYRFPTIIISKKTWTQAL